MNIHKTVKRNEKDEKELLPWCVCFDFFSLLFLFTRTEMYPEKKIHSVRLVINLKTFHFHVEWVRSGPSNKSLIFLLTSREFSGLFSVEFLSSAILGQNDTLIQHQIIIGVSVFHIEYSNGS